MNQHVEFVKIASGQGRVLSTLEHVNLSYDPDETYDPDTGKFVELPDYRVLRGKHAGSRVSELNFHYLCWHIGTVVVRDALERPETKDQLKPVVRNLLEIASAVVTPDRLAEAKTNLLKGKSLSGHHDPVIRRVENVVLARILRVNVRHWTEVDSETSGALYDMLLGADEAAENLV